jgi:hypothetical protein
MIKASTVLKIRLQFFLTDLVYFGYLLTIVTDSCVLPMYAPLFLHQRLNSFLIHSFLMYRNEVINSISIFFLYYSFFIQKYTFIG